MTRTIISCDPGLKGGIAVIYVDEDKVEFIDITLPPPVLIDKLTHIREATDLLGVAIEKVHAIPGGGAKSTFNFGYNYGAINAVLYSVVRTVFKIPPKEWQSFIGLKMSPELKGERRRREIKQQVANICLKRFPKANIFGTRGGLLDGRSDAAMIGYTLYHKYLKH